MEEKRTQSGYNIDDGGVGSGWTVLCEVAVKMVWWVDR